MRVFLLILLCLSFYGCAALQGYMNKEMAMTQRKNLNGMTYEQVRNMFGPPDSLNTFHTQSGTLETWTYSHASMNMAYSGARSMDIGFDNGVVTSVSYW